MANNVENSIVKSAKISLVVVFLFDMMLVIKGIAAIFIDKFPAVTGIVGLKLYAFAISG